MILIVIVPEDLRKRMLEIDIEVGPCTGKYTVWRTTFDAIPRFDIPELDSITTHA